LSSSFEDRQIGAYRIEDRLGKGTFGSVYRVRHVTTQAVRALKLLAPTSDATERLRFRREAELHARLDQHPNVLRIHEAGEWRGQDYLVLDYAPAGTLGDLMKVGGVSREHAVKIGIDIAHALQHLHDNGVLHRDLKPANVLFKQDGRLLIADFGLARGTGTTSLTASGLVMGSPLYMSPEQADGKRELTPATDIYSLGTVLYSMLSGQPPFRKTSSVLSLLEEVIHDPPPPLNSVAPDLDPRLVKLVHACLAKDPAQRPQRADEVARALQETIETEEASSGTRAALVAAAVGLLLVAGAVVAGWLLNREPAPDAADEPPPPVVDTAGPDEPVAPRANPARALIDELRESTLEDVERAWRELPREDLELTLEEATALSRAAYERGRVLTSARGREFPPLATLCCEVLGYVWAAHPELATVSFGDAVIVEAVRRAEATAETAAAEAATLDWVEPACTALAAQGLPVTDVEALELLDLLWDGTGVRFRGHTKRRVQILVSLLSLGALPGADFASRLPRDELQRSDPIQRFMLVLNESPAPMVIYEPSARIRDMVEALHRRLSDLLEDYRDSLPIPARNAIELWWIQVSVGEQRMNALEELAPQIPAYQPRLRCAAALVALWYLEEEPPPELLERATELARRMVESVDERWILRAARTDTISRSDSETLIGVLLTYLAVEDYPAFNRLRAACPRSVHVAVSDQCPPWLKGRLDEALGQ